MSTEAVSLRDFHHVYEPGKASSSPVLLLLHGTGGDEQELLGLGRSVLPDGALLSVRGQVSEAGMPRFFRRISPGVFDLPDAVARAADLAGFVRAARAGYLLSDRPIVAVGYSNGANIAHLVLLRHAGVLQGAALLRPMVVTPPPDAGGLAGTPVLLLSGRNDPTVPAGQPEALAERITVAGGKAQLVYTGDGHGLGHHDVRTLRQWLAETPFPLAGVGAY
jgi:predicted esterase